VALFGPQRSAESREPDDTFPFFTAAQAGLTRIHIERILRAMPETPFDTMSSQQIYASKGPAVAGRVLVARRRIPPPHPAHRRGHCGGHRGRVGWRLERLVDG